MKSKIRHVHGGAGHPRVHGGFVEQMRFEKNRGFKKDTQIQIYKPRSKGMPMKSKTRHVDGGCRNPQCEASRIWVFYFHQKLMSIDDIDWDAALLNYNYWIKTNY